MITRTSLDVNDSRTNHTSNPLSTRSLDSTPQLQISPVYIRSVPTSGPRFRTKEIWLPLSWNHPAPCPFTISDDHKNYPEVPGMASLTCMAFGGKFL
ncbi:hypothetical protein T02_1855 [Trichinella nativa]|uniref:Uncharacterized protein n=1 Tax=Trichinella nativa TaxID=6335 RepID=A0A0V1KNF3_9BILA|nr:hypothetical protein T02_1855 [Trichinella nativa]